MDIAGGPGDEGDVSLPEGTEQAVTLCPDCNQPLEDHPLWARSD